MAVLWVPMATRPPVPLCREHALEAITSIEGVLADHRRARAADPPER